MHTQAPGSALGIDRDGCLIELGWFKIPTLMHLAWQVTALPCSLAQGLCAVDRLPGAPGLSGACVVVWEAGIGTGGHSCSHAEIEELFVV